MENWRRELDELKANLAENRSSRRTQSNPEEAIGGAIALGIGLGALVAYGFKWLTSGTEPEKEEQLQTQQRSYQSVPLPLFPSGHRESPLTQCEYYTRQRESGLVDSRIIIAVDATKERAGGFIHLPKSEEIYFYSIDWSEIFYFPDEPDKFEMVNALLALEIFEDYVRAYRRQYANNDSLVVMTDNTFCTSLDPARTYPGPTNGEYRQLFRTINEKLTTAPFNGRWNYVPDSGSNVFMKIADKLSRADYSLSRGLPQLPNRSDPFPSFSEENISKTDYAVLHTVARQVPMELQQRKEGNLETFSLEELREMYFGGT